jgi:hypothetical protein
VRVVHLSTSSGVRAEPAPLQRAIDRLIAFGFGFAIAAVLFQAMAHLTYVFLTDGRAGELNLDAEQGAFSWVSSGTTFCAAFVSFLLALFRPQRRARLFALAAIFALFSLDDAIELHERLGESATTNLFNLGKSFNYALWPVLFFPLLGLAFLLLWDVSRSSAGRGRRTLRVGMALLVVGVAAEAAASAWYVPGGEAETWPGALQIIVEESAELAGWILIVTALTVETCRALLLLPATANSARDAVGGIGDQSAPGAGASSASDTETTPTRAAGGRTAALKRSARGRRRARQR